MTTTIEVALGALSTLAWLYLLLGRGWFWREAHRCSTWNTCGKAQTGNEPMVVAVIPARNESATIGRSVASLFGQQLAGRMRVIVVDDQSDDGTAEVAEAAARQTGVQDRLTIITGKALPAGWSGKVWAMQQGIEAARALNPAWFLLTDADVAHAPGNLAGLVAVAESGPYDLASLMVRLHCESVAERLLIPAFVHFFFLLYPPQWIADPRKKTAGAAGGCMLLRPEALERAGGMAAIRGEVIDDCALARAVKAHGARLKAQGGGGVADSRKYPPCLANPGQAKGGATGRTCGHIWLGLSDETASVRPYGSFREIGRMIARSAFNQLHHSALLLAGALLGMVMAFVVPVALVLVYPTLAKTGLGWATRGQSWATPEQVWGTVAVALGAVAWSLMTLAYLPMVRFYRLNPLWATTLPAAACFYMGATLASALKYWTGRGGEWKGRVQDV